MDDQTLSPYTHDPVKIKLTKIRERSDAIVANNIPTGDYRIGYLRRPLLTPIIGKRYFIESVVNINGTEVSPLRTFLTSPVVEIIDSFTFKTENSVYQIELYHE